MRQVRELTPRQKEMLDFLAQYIKENRFAPTYEELMKHLKLKTKSAIHRHVYSLAQKGAITVGTGRRAIKLIDLSKCPHCGGDI